MNNLMLYGSYARKESIRNSDVDLLSIGVSRFVKKTVKNSVNLTQYPYGTLKNMATNGSLFIYHLKEEGQILSDEKNRFEILFNDYFFLKNSYDVEKYFSYQLLQKIYKIYPTLENLKFANLKIVWCLRTIFAAIGAESQLPMFSSKKIMEQFGESYSEILSLKKSNKKDVKGLEKVLIKIEELLPNLTEHKIPTDLINYEKRIMKNLQNKEYLSALEFY
jgi:hypothetical protein